ncbi:MAG: shikimate dehydrogenase [Aequorivita sp.]|nr:shikimate dehydrogenase [Aequorivita sp.]|tara:strand:+ start:30963 stop:31694 length:732 start_codon:yes stop_codon:yes gene_type:complete
MAKFGLIGRNISYSFSKKYFSEKFEKEQLNHTYENFDIQTIAAFPRLFQQTDNLKGFNVTIPYKEEIIPFLDELSLEAREIGAVNTIKISKKHKLIGYNTDYYGFKKALEPHLPIKRKTALILGTGGASKAIAYTLKNLGFQYKLVSRQQTKNTLQYSQLTQRDIENNFLIVNCTPLGTHPNTLECPLIPYQFVNENHLLFDLIYNPAETTFLKHGKTRGAKIENGLKMLEFQANKAWEIWNS